jgi:hypothetical protein
MIHPNTELKFISERVGYGVFAASDIPEGTIVYVKDSLELVVSPTDYLMHSEDMKEVIGGFAQRGVIEWPAHRTPLFFRTA